MAGLGQQIIQRLQLIWFFHGRILPDLDLEGKERTEIFVGARLNKVGGGFSLPQFVLLF
jgi:hypothetical protein